jgi:hypothetical protein
MTAKPIKNKLIRKNQRKIRQIIALETDYYFLEALKLELKHSKSHFKMQRKIWKTPSWKDYVR